VGRARQTSTEGCLSLPGYSGHVDRPKKVRVTALDENGKTQTIEAEDMLAVILCHEIDHLDGILYKDKASEYFENGSQEE
jgi:peptide deformylase